MLVVVVIVMHQAHDLVAVVKAGISCVRLIIIIIMAVANVSVQFHSTGIEHSRPEGA